MGGNGGGGRKPGEVLGLPTLVAPRYQSSAVRCVSSW